MINSRFEDINGATNCNKFIQTLLLFVIIENPCRISQRGWIPISYKHLYFSFSADSVVHHKSIILAIAKLIDFFNEVNTTIILYRYSTLLYKHFGVFKFD